MKQLCRYILLYTTAFCVNCFDMDRLAAGAGSQDSVRASIVAATSTVKEKAGILQRKLRACSKAGHDITLPDASLAVAELFLQFSQYDATIPTRCVVAQRSLTYLAKMLDDTICDVDNVLHGKASFPSIPHWNVVGLDVREGGIWSDNEQVLLSGFNWNAGLAQHEPQLLKRLGVNLVDGMFRGGMMESGGLNDTWYNGRDRAYLEKMERENFAVDAMLSLAPPDWIFKRYPDLRSPGYGHYTDYAIDHPALADYRRNVLDQLVPLYARHKALFAVDLANEPAYQGASDYMFANWRVWLQKKYGSIGKVNEAWGTDFVSFDSIDRFPAQPMERKNEWQRAQINWNEPGTRGMHYDWCAFNKQRVTEFFTVTDKCIRAHAPRVNTHVKVMLGNYFTGGTEKRGWPMAFSYNTFGIDLEAISDLCSVNGGDDSFPNLSEVDRPNRYFGSSPYVAGWLNSGLATDLMKSVAPDKPVYDSEFHVVEVVDDEQIEPSSAEHMKLALWHAHLHGMTANLLWYWGRTVDGSVSKQGEQWFDGSLLEQPWLLHAYAQESLTLRRFVPQVTAFARQACSVHLLYSDTSAIQDVHAIDTLRDAYEALNFLGVHVGFVTERQLSAGWLDEACASQTRLLIVPNATYVADETVRRLVDVARAGMPIRIIGKDSLARNPVGKQRAKPVIAGAETVGLATAQDYHRHMNRWLEQAGIVRELIARDQQGSPAWGVEVRTARIGDQRLVYLINLMRTPLTVELNWHAPGVRIRDLRTGRVFSDSVTLQPRQVILGTYSVEAGKSATEGQAGLISSEPTYDHERLSPPGVETRCLSKCGLTP